MQIEDLALRELFMTTVCEVADKEKRRINSAKSTGVSTLSQQLNNNRSIMDNLADEYDDLGKHDLAESTREIAKALDNNDLLSMPNKNGRTRLLDYVYPIV